jgi:hypothetical protein
MGNPINPRTGTRYIGRVSQERIERDKREFGDATGHPSVNESDTGTATGNADDNGSARSAAATGNAEKIRNVFSSRTGDKPSRVAVKSQTEGPKETKPRNVKPTESGFIKPEHIETWMVQLFGLVAMVKNADYWAIKRPDIEVRPWAGSGAEIINKLSGEQAEKIAQYNAAASVTVGIVSLVLARSQMDRMVASQRRLEHAKTNVETRKREEGIPTQNINPDVPAGQNGHATVSGTGATPVAPQETLFGNDSAI